MFAKLLLGAAATLVAYAFYLVFIKPRFSPLRSLPGPPSESIIWGNLRQVLRADGATKHEEWVQKYGNTYVYKALFNNDRLFTTDMRALNHIITHSVIYQKPLQGRRNLSRIVGNGILVAEGDVHKQQRRIMNPSFGPAHIAKLTPIFFEKAMQMRDVWDAQIPQTDAKSEDTTTIEVLSWLGRATLDVIGQAGFDYQFHALDVKRPVNELNKAFSTLFHSEGRVPILAIIAGIVPGFEHVPTKRNRTSKQAHATMNSIGRQLVADRKRAVLGELSVEDIKRDRDNFSYTHDDKTAKPSDTDYDIAERGPPEDLLSALIKANLDTELPDSQRLGDEAVLSQIPTFLVAGHETTSTGTTWALYALAQAPAIQTRLREELRAVPTDAPSMDELMVLPYLDAVVRETMRIHAAVPSTIREATQDDVIPIGGNGYVDRNGVRRQEIKVKKGDTIFIPILVVNRSKEIWGEDALEFNPERWTAPPEASKAIPGVWGNQLSFLGGARSCIGYRFALVEMKALLFTIIRAFEFELAVPVDDIEKRSMVVTRPYLKSQKKLGKGAQLPLKIKRVTKA